MVTPDGQAIGDLIEYINGCAVGYNLNSKFFLAIISIPRCDYWKASCGLRPLSLLVAVVRLSAFSRRTSSTRKHHK
jgi:hypothetical protein